MVSATDESLLPWFTLNVDDGIVLLGKFGRKSEKVNCIGSLLVGFALLVIFAFDMLMKQSWSFIGGKIKKGKKEPNSTNYPILS